MSKQAILKNLPSVDELLRDEDLGQLTKGTPRSLVKETVRQVLESIRRKILEAPEGDEPEIRGSLS
ncbi:MAG: hypothetical protein HY788_10335 [Deltaproteobacteria bacterium]|nr:hypothetical protein [Deltaproteobacteria bacterium]